MIKSGTAVKVTKHRSPDSEGLNYPLNYPSFEGMLMEDCDNRSSDIVDVELMDKDDCSRIVQVYSHSVSFSETVALSEVEVCELITESLCESHPDIRVQTFEERCLLTMNKGITLMVGSKEYFITVSSQ